VCARVQVEPHMYSCTFMPNRFRVQPYIDCTSTQGGISTAPHKASNSDIICASYGSSPHYSILSDCIEGIILYHTISVYHTISYYTIRLHRGCAAIPFPDCRSDANLSLHTRIVKLNYHLSILLRHRGVFLVF